MSKIQKILIALYGIVVLIVFSKFIPYNVLITVRPGASSQTQYYKGTIFESIIYSSFFETTKDSIKTIITYEMDIIRLFLFVFAISIIFATGFLFTLKKKENS